MQPMFSTLGKRSISWPTLIFAGVCIGAIGLKGAAADEENPIYDSDPRHLWNRLHEALFIRTAPDGKKYGGLSRV